MERLREVLSEFLKLQGVVNAGLVREDGSVIEFVGGEGRETFSIPFSTSFSIAEKLGEKLEAGKPNQIIYDYENAYIILECLSKGLILFLVCSKDISLGTIRFFLKEKSDTLRKVISEVEGNG